MAEQIGKAIDRLDNAAPVEVDADSAVDRERYTKLVEFYREYLFQKGYDNRNPEMHLAISRMMAASFMGIVRKGLMFHGIAGSGKTMGLERATKYMAGRVWSAELLAGKDARNRVRHLPSATEYDWQRPQDALLDDLGAEVPINDYGVKRETMTEYITGRYDEWKICGALTHISTNLTDKELTERYGDRAVSRLREMCVWVGSGNTDWRRERPRTSPSLFVPSDAA